MEYFNNYHNAIELQQQYDRVRKRLYDEDDIEDLDRQFEEAGENLAFKLNVPVEDLNLKKDNTSKEDVFNMDYEEWRGKNINQESFDFEINHQFGKSVIIPEMPAERILIDGEPLLEKTGLEMKDIANEDLRRKLLEVLMATFESAKKAEEEKK